MYNFEGQWSRGSCWWRPPAWISARAIRALCTPSECTLRTTTHLWREQRAGGAF